MCATVKDQSSSSVVCECPQYSTGLPIMQSKDMRGLIAVRSKSRIAGPTSYTNIKYFPLLVQCEMPYSAVMRGWRPSLPCGDFHCVVKTEIMGMCLFIWFDQSETVLLEVVHVGYAIYCRLFSNMYR